MGDCGCLFRGQADVSLLTPVHKKNFVATLQLCSKCSTSSAGTMEELTQRCSSVTVLTVVVVCGC
jgi:hypothetical protein